MCTITTGARGDADARGRARARLPGAGGRAAHAGGARADRRARDAAPRGHVPVHDAARRRRMRLLHSAS